MSMNGKKARSVNVKIRLFIVFLLRTLYMKFLFMVILVYFVQALAGSLE